MSDDSERTAATPEAGERHATPARRPWSTPQLILAKASGDTENASYLPDDGPFSVS
jgi:hypothetical protein